MGFVGFFVKLIFIPINNIIVGSGQGLEDGMTGCGDSVMPAVEPALHPRNEYRS
uniref:Uncharacterized protein n=1 Tax=Aegilops tauschii TaxID=37682 RepID=N1R0P2_AEGTA